MDKKVTVFIRDKLTEPPILVTEGTLTKIGNSYNIRYRDDDSFYTIGISDKMITVTREGEEDYTLILQEGQEYRFNVSSPFGDIPMTALPERARFEDKKETFSLRLIYTINGGGHKQKFRLYIDCRNA